MKFAVFNHQLVNVRDAKNHVQYKCPFCHKRMVYHQGSPRRKAYFSHVLSAKGFNNPGETSEHLLGKQQLASFFKTLHNSVKIEYYLSKINQWPDLMVNDIVIEFQCSPISIYKLNKRISGYSMLKLKSWWILGSPYQKRYLRPAYVARFLNYSTNLGFFLLFWQVNLKRLEIHYALCEYGTHFSYRIKYCTSLADLKYFMQHNQLPIRPFNRNIIRSAIKSDVKQYQLQLFHGDVQLLKLQQQISIKHNSLMGCPIICHLPIVNPPILKKRALIWHIIILLLINKSSRIDDIYNRANAYVGIPLTFCQISDYKKLYERSFFKYLKILAKHHYIKLNIPSKKITKLKKPRWFNSAYDKVLYINNYY